MTGFIIPTEQEGVILRQLTTTDAEAYFDAVDANREHLSQYGDTTAANYPDLESVVESIVNPVNPDKVRMGIWAGQIFVGSINATPDVTKKDNFVEIGYWLDERHTGHGYATVAVKAFAGRLIEHYSDVIAKVDINNQASARVLERANFEPYYTRGDTVSFIYDNPNELDELTSQPISA